MVPRMRRLILTLIALAIVPDANAATPRSPETPKEFQRLNPCPSTGKNYGGCPGYIRDHIIPLCLNGPDTPANMQWQTVEDSLRKDDEERAACRRMHYEQRRQIRELQWES